MKTLTRLISILAICLIGLFAILHVIPLPVGASLLTKNPQPISLKGIDGTKHAAQLQWDNPKIRLRGFHAQAQISGTFIDSAQVLNTVINPSRPMAVVNKSKIKVWQLNNSTLACAGVAEGLQCVGKIRMQIDTFLGKIKNTLTLTSKSNSALEGNEITLSHRILDGDGVPALVIEALNKELAAKDRTKSLPDFFIDHNVAVTDHAFIGKSTDNTLGLRLTLNMPLGELLKSIF
jgi:hypothetical protein